jgi:hypothetical protein
MKKLIFIFLLAVFNSHSFSQHFDHLFDLRGMEDYNNNTHLYYRYGLLFENVIDCWKKNLYHFDLASGIDSFYLSDRGYPYEFGDCRGISVKDFDFYDDDPQKYIWGGVDYYLDPIPKLMRFDGEVHLETIGYVTKIEFSKQTDSLTYVSVPPSLFKSTDNGYNFELLDSIVWIDNAMISLSDNNDSQIYGINGNKLLRSENEGGSYQIVDEDEHWYNWIYNYDFYYDSDGQHIYGVCNSPTESALIFSDSNGDSSSWNTSLVYNGYITFTYDRINSGEVYYSAGKKIYHSTSFGTSFKLLTEFDDDVTGLYKKSGTDTLYVATLLNIYRITTDSISIVRSKPAPNYLLEFYPLAIGNVWVYNQSVYNNATGDTIDSYYKRKITGETTMPNGKTYYILNEFDAYIDSTFIFYERIDPTTFNLFRYDPDSVQTNQEYLLDDLFVLLGDTIKGYRYFPHFSEVRVTIYKDAREFQDFGLQYPVPRIQFNTYSATNNEFNYFLTYAIGLDSFYINKSNQYSSTFDLRGFIIDGILHGDTTTVAVEDEILELPTKFSLLQNYPNPFNPNTVIRYQLPVTSNVFLKVYDILGNEVATLVNEEKQPGEYEIEFNPVSGIRNLVSGIYFYQLKAGNFIETKKMVYLK